jgi:hypothetical protein
MSFVPINSTDAQVSIMRKSLYVQHYQNNTSKTYSSQIINATVSSYDGNVHVRDFIMPEAISDSSAFTNSTPQYRWFIDTTCSPDFYILEGKSLTSNGFFHRSSGCLQFSPSLSGYSIVEMAYLPGFGEVYDHREWGEFFSNPFYKTIKSYPYIKLGACSIGTKAIISEVTEPDKKQTRIFLYPNPARNGIRLAASISDKDLKLKVYNTTGTPVLQKEYVSAGENIDVSGLIPGIYFAQISSGKDSHIVRLIIEK